MTKTSDSSKLRSFFNNVTKEKTVSALRSFFMGKWYPIWVAFSVLIGRFTCTELYFAMIDFVLVSIALLICDSIRPLLPNLITFLYRIPVDHGPGTPYYSDYYFTEPVARLIPFLMLGFLVVLGYFLIKHKAFAGFNPLRNILFMPTLALATAFLTAGILSGNRQPKDTGFTILEFIFFFVVLFVLYFGLRMEKIEELTDYFIYIATVCSVVLIVEVLGIFVNLDQIIVDGSVEKGNIRFGWGIANTCASCLSVLIPISVLGAMRASRRYIAFIYLGIASINLLAIFLTLARTSLLFGAAAYIVCLIISCFAGKQRWASRIVALVIVVGVLAVFICFSDQIAHIFARYVEKGFSDSGRFNFWRYFYSEFEKAPVFGNGFYHFRYGIQHTDFAPSLAHNTLIELLAATGLVGFCAYLVYRVFTLIPFFKKFTITKLMLLGSCLVLISESFIDNFIFWFNPTFVYNICIVLAVMHCEQTKREELKDAGDVRDVVCDNVEKTSSVEENT